MPPRKRVKKKARTRPKAAVEHPLGPTVGAMALRLGEARVLEMVATDAPLLETLDTLARVFEKQANGMLASILLVEDGKRVRHATAPSLSPEWAKIVDGEPIGPNRGSCGTAAYLKEPVIATNIATDPRWELYRDAALKFGYRACWSTPIFGPDQTVLGTFAFYYTRPRRPTAVLLELASHASHLASIAIQRHGQKAELRESEQRAQLIVEHALDANVQMEANGNVLAWSPRATAIFGWSADEAIGRRLSDLIIPIEFRAQHEAGLRRFFTTGENVVLNRRLEVTAMHRDGHFFPVELAVTPIQMGGRVTFSAFVQDVTEKKHAEEALRESQQHLSLVYDNSADVLFHLQVEPAGFRFASANPAFGASTGVDPRHIVGKLVGDVIPEPSRSLVLAKYAEAIRTRTTVRWEEVTEYPTGVRRGDVAITPVFDEDGHAKYLIGSVRDVTDQVRLTEENRRLREREQLHAALDLAPSAVAIAHEGVVRYANPAFVKLFGIGQGDDMRETYVDAQVRTEIAAQVSAGMSVVNASVQAYGAEGGTLDLIATYRPIEYEGKHAQLTYLVDVTALKQGEQALRAAKEAAEAATRAKSLFLASMSHEIRTPMNAILGYAQILQRDEALSASQKAKVDVIHTSGNHLLTLINDVLEMSRIEAGRTTLMVKPFDLLALLHDIELMFAELTSVKGVLFVVDTREALAEVLDGDAGKVRQVMINLLSNAVKFTERGQITVTASSQLTDAAQWRVTIAVQDTGMGIAPDDVGRIFDVFAQPEGGLRPGGSGLGLAISRNFARLMGGDLIVRSTLGSGSTFEFSFVAPASTSAVRRDSRPIPVGIADEQPTLRALIVDDVATNRDLMQECLDRYGFETRVASGAEEGLAIHEAWKPDLVLMDLRMPGVDGMEAMSRLRAADTNARVIAVTASVMPDTELDAIAAGFDGFIRKPYKESELLAIIGELLGIRYKYAGDPPRAATLPSSPSALIRDRSLLSAELVSELREAAIEARALRIHQIADQVAQVSPDAASAIRELADAFEYDRLLEALTEEVAS